MKHEDYLKQNARGILHPMVSAVFLENPKEPVTKNIMYIIILKYRYYS